MTQPRVNLQPRETILAREAPEPREIPLPRRPDPPSPYTFPVLATLAPVIASVAMWAITQSVFALMFAVLGPLVAVGSVLDARVQGRRRMRRELRRFEADAAATVVRIDREHERLRRDHWHRSRSSAALLPAALHDAERWRHEGGSVPVIVGVGQASSGIRMTGSEAVPDLAPVPDSAPVPDLAPVASAPRSGSPADGPGGVPARRRRRRGRTRRIAPRARVEAELRRLERSAARIDDVPITVDATLGIGLCGTRATALAAARSLVLQLADSLPPGRFVIAGGFEDWHARLPHAAGAPSLDVVRPSRIEFIDTTRGHDAATAIVVVVADSAEALPRECRIGLEAAGAGVRMLRHPQLALLGRDGVAVVPPSFRAEFVSELDAASFADTLSAAAVHEGLTAVAASPPVRVRLDEVWDAPAEGALPAAFLADGDGAVVLDLVVDGPHAVVGGTTGSGKSELLISWILAIARRRSPAHVNFLLVDFKGGASFTDVAGLPHSVGLITDLDQASAARALESLRAELRHRERVIAAGGGRSIDDLASGVLPRLVVVVDEFAAMVSEFPELHALFSDVAARGRSLGVHVILCTQRPGGVLRDAVMANCTLRISLRVSNGHDSAAVVGTDAAAALPRHPVGRCLVSVAGEPPALAQVAMADPGLASIATRDDGAHVPRRPWLPPLPSRVALEDLPGVDSPEPGTIAFGLLDLPEQQRQPPALWRPAAEGNLLVIGGQRSGKSGTVAAIAAAARRSAVAVRHVGHDIELAWDAVAALAAGDHVRGDQFRGDQFRGDRGGGGEHGGLVAIDDLDSLVGRMPEQYASAFLDMLTTVLRESSSLGVGVVVSVQRITPGIQSLVPLFGERLLLRLPTRHDHVLAGGDGAEHHATAPPGRGRWRGAAVQVATVQDTAVQVAAIQADGVDVHAEMPERSTPGDGGARRAFDFTADGPLTIVTPRAGAFAAELDRLGRGDRVCAPAEVPTALAADAAPIAIGDAMAWQAAWTAFGAMRTRGPVVFDRCTPVEFRLVTGRSLPPPPLSAAPGGGWMLSPHGDVARVQIAPVIS